MSFESGVKKALDKSAIEELSKIPAALTLLVKNATDIKGLLLIERLAISTFNAMVSHGLTWDETVNRMEDPLRMMLERHAEFKENAHPDIVEIVNLINIDRSKKAWEKLYVN